MKRLIKILEKSCKGKMLFKQKRQNLYQVLLPVYYEDGDMIDIFVEPVSGEDGFIRLIDCGTTLMKLSYTYEINTPSKEKIFNRILTQSGINEESGNLYLESDPDQLFHSLMQFTGCQQKIINMKMWERETIRSLFFQELEEFIDNELVEYNPEKNISPLPDYPVVEADYRFEYNGKIFYLFGVSNKDKAKNSAIALLEFQKADLKYIGIVVHEAIDSLPKKDQMYLTQNADKQFISIEDFRSYGNKFIKRTAA